MEVNDVVKAPCNRCGETNHLVVAVRQQTDTIAEGIEPGEPGINLVTEYSMLECGGCQSITICVTDHDGDIEGPVLITEYYPPRVRRHKPTWVWELPAELSSLLNEIYAALADDSRRLALMGTRAVLDFVMTKKVGDRGTFQSKLTGLEEAGFIGKSNAHMLDVALDAGNAAAHRAYRPPSEILNQIMDIVENLLQAVYILPKSIKGIRRSTPRRRTRGAPKQAKR